MAGQPNSLLLLVDKIPNDHNNTFVRQTEPEHSPVKVRLPKRHLHKDKNDTDGHSNYNRDASTYGVGGEESGYSQQAKAK